MPSGDGQPRTYSISADTATGSVNPALLFDQILADGAITTALRDANSGGWFDSDGDVMNVWFVAPRGGAEITALDALVGVHDGDPTDAKYQFWESNPAQTTTNEAFTEVLSRTAARMKQGTYRVSWYFELKLTPTGPVNSLAMAQMLTDASVKGSAATDSVEWIAFSGWDRFIAAEGAAPVLSLEIQRDPTVGGNDTVEIRKMKLGIEQMI